MLGATVTEGQGADSRVTQFSYAGGFLASVTDPLGRTATYTVDASGRLTEQTLPGGRTSRRAYDANGNVTSLVPPGRAEHAFSYTARDEVSAHTGPTVGAENSQTRYTYAADGQPTLVEPRRPDHRLRGTTRLAA